ncbi:hypothetical protein BDV06DRAFT_9935 [Aspergillus oleicola]
MNQAAVGNLVMQNESQGDPGLTFERKLLQYSIGRRRRAGADCGDLRARLTTNWGNVNQDSTLGEMAVLQSLLTRQGDPTMQDDDDARGDSAKMGWSGGRLVREATNNRAVYKRTTMVTENGVASRQRCKLVFPLGLLTMRTIRAQVRKGTRMKARHWKKKKGQQNQSCYEHGVVINHPCQREG